MNNKILSVVLVAGIATTSFAGISAANNSGSLLWDKSEIRELMVKSESGEALTSDEQALLDEAKTKFQGKKSNFKRNWFKSLTEEEKTAIESMSDEEKQAFFESKKEEKMAQMEAGKSVINKLITGESLTADEEALRLEMLAKFESEDNSHPQRKGGWDIIAKILAWDELTEDEANQVIEMQAKQAERAAEKAKIEAMSDTEKEQYFEDKKLEREAQRETMMALKEKVESGEALSDDEQALIDNAKNQMGKGKWGKHRR